MSRSPPTPDRNWALFLDLDGTLIDIAATPDGVVVPPELPALLSRVERAFDGALAVVSGRPLDRLDRLLQPWRGAVAAEHGARCRLPSGQIIEPEPRPAVPTAWRTAFEAIVAGDPGVVVENKESSITLHYRQAPAQRASLLAAAERLVATRAEDFAITSAHMAIEIRPRAIDKSVAVHRLMQEPPFRARVPVFVGDDVTDEDGMRAARELGGVGLRVNEYFPQGTAGVREWLIGIAERLGSK